MGPVESIKITQGPIVEFPQIILWKSISGLAITIPAGKTSDECIGTSPASARNSVLERDAQAQSVTETVQAVRQFTRMLFVVALDKPIQ